LKTQLTLAESAARLAALALPIGGPRFDLFVRPGQARPCVCLAGVTFCQCRCGDQPLPPMRLLFLGFGHPGATAPMFQTFSTN
jgi:hypothetical protein